MPPILSIGPFKQEILKGYNQINKKIFNSGVKEQKVDILQNKIYIFSVNPRVPVLKTLDEIDSMLARQIDSLLIDRFKLEIKLLFESYFHIRVAAVLKDYDVLTGNSGTVIILERSVEDLLNDVPKLPNG